MADPVFADAPTPQAPEVPKVARPSTPGVPESTEALPPAQTTPEAKPSYVKLAMRNMVRKRGKSLYHFTLTTIGLLTLLVGLAYLTR
ncbi:DUF3285 domain-containing protein [Egbenema bharatensis]|uniref:DUF3285 domain-containing protein n=1 Tax=Egbenema bharatensis TaxID=3463334 RepID=UPI003A86F49B